MGDFVLPIPSTLELPVANTGLCPNANAAMNHDILTTETTTFESSLVVADTQSTETSALSGLVVRMIARMRQTDGRTVPALRACVSV